MPAPSAGYLKRNFAASPLHHSQLRASTRGAVLRSLVARTESGGRQGSSGRVSLTRVFDAMDLNQDGKLNEQEVKIALAKVRGRPVSEQELETFWESVDIDGDKTISTEEFFHAAELGQAQELSDLSAAQVRIF